MCSLFGRCFLTSFLVRPGKEARKPASMEERRVDVTGDPREAWWNWAKSFFVVSDRMIALQVDRRDVGGVLSSRLTSHMLLGP